MRTLRADYLFPCSSPPIEKGLLVVGDDGTIMAVVDPRKEDHSKEGIEDFEGVLCPGFVNAHCHLELSYMKNRLNKGLGLTTFLKEVESIKTATIPVEEKLEAMLLAEREMIENGIVAVGDISNTDMSFAIKQQAKLHYHTFFEVYGSNPKHADQYYQQAKDFVERIPQGLSWSVTPHATYSVSPDLLTRLSNLYCEQNVLSIHHLESPYEHDFFAEGTGPVRERLARFGTDAGHLSPFGKLPLETIAPYLPPCQKLQLVHNTFATEPDLNYASGHFQELYWCLCPQSNLYVEQTLPPEWLLRHPLLKRTIGTDSLATNNTLSVLEEMKTLAAHTPLPLEELITWATINGAQLLGIEAQAGSFEIGKKPGVNLIHGLDVPTMALLPATSVRKIL